MKNVIQCSFTRALLFLLPLASGIADARLEDGGHLSVTTTLPAASQFATTYSQTLSTTGGTSPYTYKLLSQTSRNPATWRVSSSGVVTNAMPMLLNVETANLTVQVTDASQKSITASIPVTTNRAVPAGAHAAGYNTLLYCSQPTPGDVYTGAYGTTPGKPWSSGWPFSGKIPPSSLYSASPTGVLQMTQSGGGKSPSSTTPIISGVQLSNGSHVPVASTLPLITTGNGYYLDALIQISVGDPKIRPAVFAFPTQHNIGGTQDIDPNDGNTRRWLEKDTWEGSGGNGKQTVGAWNGALVWSNVRTALNPNFGPADITLEHEYGSAYIPGSGALNRYIDESANGSQVASSSSGVPLTTEQLNFVNNTTDYTLIAAFNDGTTPFVMSVYEVCVYVAP
jgi:hypothetical protein